MSNYTEGINFIALHYVVSVDFSVLIKSFWDIHPGKPHYFVHLHIKSFFIQMLRMMYILLGNSILFLKLAFKVLTSFKVLYI